MAVGSGRPQVGRSPQKAPSFQHFPSPPPAEQSGSVAGRSSTAQFTSGTGAPGQMKKDVSRASEGTIHREIAALPGRQAVPLGGRGCRGSRKWATPRAPDTDPTLRLWDVPTGVEVGRTTFPRVPWSVDVAPDGAHALGWSGELDGSVRPDRSAETGRRPRPDPCSNRRNASPDIRGR